MIGPLVAIVTFIFSRKKITNELGLVLAFCVVQFICNIIASALSTYYIPNYAVYKINTVASLIILLLLFSRHLLQFNKKMNYLVYAFIILVIIPTFFGEGITSYNSYSATLSSFIIVAFCLYYFSIKLLRSNPEESVPATAIFWCVVGIFIYYAGSFFIFLSYKYLIETDIKSIGALWKFHNLLLFIACISISYGVLCKDYRPTS